jgi:glucose/mannose-6-phosphate isomerase
MKNLIQKFPSNLIQAVEIAKSNPLKKDYARISNVLICGLGGSGIGGKLVNQWFEKELNVPVTICQTYDIPNFVNQNTLVIGSSYSGNTEETLSAINQAHERNARVVTVCSGGKLAEFCAQHDYEYILVPGGNPPRSQLGFSIVQLTHFFHEAGLISKSQLDKFIAAAKLLQDNLEEIQQAAQTLADFMYSREVVIYAQSDYEGVAVRARQQFNENAKILCSHHVIPEMNHNELVGWAGGKINHAVVLLRTDDEHPQNKKRFDFTKQTVSSKTLHLKEVCANFNDIVLNSIYLIHIIDWASVYLADKMNVDSMEVNVIDKLKSSL